MSSQPPFARVTDVMPGCKISHTSVFEALLGCPSEIVKVLEIKGLGLPDKIFLPALMYQYGIVQAALEFPIFKMLFFKQYYFQGKRPSVFGTAKQIERMRQILRLTLLGPSYEDMDKWGIDKATQIEFRVMSDALAVHKKGTNEVASIDDLVEFVCFTTDGTLEYQGVKVKILAPNVFEFTDGAETWTADININEPQRPPLPIVMPERFAERSTLGAIALSKCTTGFDPTGYTSGVLLSLNGMFALVDSSAWTKEHLRHLGINPHEISVFIDTHIHEDHCNIFGLVVNGKVSYAMSDDLGYWCILTKIALTLDRPVEEVKEYIRQVRIELGKPFDWYGAKFEFWRAVHTVPTLGFRVTLNGHSIIYTGDTLWGKKLTALLEKGAISQDLHDFIQRIPEMASDLTFFDAGGGLIHPDIEELAALPPQLRRAIVPTHLSQVPPHLQHSFQSLVPGQSWTFVEAKSWDVNAFRQVQNAPILAGLSPMWFNVLLHQGQLRDYPKNHNLLELGKEGKGFYIVIAGTLSVMEGDEVIAQLSTGDFFGEMSIMFDVPCNASVRTNTPVRLLEISKEIFNLLIKDSRILEMLMKIHQFRPIFMQFHQFRELSVGTQNKIFVHAQKRMIPAGTRIIAEGTEPDNLYGIIEGEAEVLHNDGGGSIRHVATLGPNQLFGEIALIKGQKRTADVVAKTDLVVFSLAKADFDRLREEAPIFSMMLMVLAESRLKERI